MPVFQIAVADGGVEDFETTDGWGEVPEVDRPVWSRYMLDHCPWFPGATIVSFIASGVVNGGSRVPEVWKETAAELHSGGFTPLQYYLLAQLLSDKRRRNELDEATHGHLFKQWYKEGFPAFQLDAEAWKPWLERLVRAQSPRRALDHMLFGPDLPALGMVMSLSGGLARVVSD